MKFSRRPSEVAQGLCLKEQGHSEVEHALHSRVSSSVLHYGMKASY